MRHRQAFTLVELLVCMALILFMMAILSQAFVTATQTFHNLKAAGDLAEKLRAVSIQLRRELAADHFEGKKRLSQPSFWDSGPPRQGFFRIYQGSRSQSEGVDADGIASYRSADHALHFTVKLRGNQEGDFFSAGVPIDSPLLTPIFGNVEARYQNGNAYRSQWAEVAYFLRPSVDAQNVTDTANGTPLYSLYRRQRLAVPNNVVILPQPTSSAPQYLEVPASLAPQYLEVSCTQDPANPNSLCFNTPLDLTVPVRRFGADSNGLPSVTVPNYGLSYPLLSEQTTDANLQSADLVLDDVISFDIRVLFAANTGSYGGPTDPRNPFLDLYDPSLAGYDNGNAVLFAANGPRVFDTWSSIYSGVPGLPDYSTWNVPSKVTSIPMWKATASPPGPIIQAIQITIRIWDAKTSLTRQTTIVQAM